MNIISKSADRSNVVFVFSDDKSLPPEPGVMFSLYGPEFLKSSSYVDDPVMRIRIFELPTPKLKYIFEPRRMRLEEEGHREPNESRLAEEASRVCGGLYPEGTINAYGFNYDITCRMNNVIPQREILKQFFNDENLERVKDFGWQYTIAKDKGRQLETYFFKAVSPIEFSIHVNYHFIGTPTSDGQKLQEQFERCYNEVDGVFLQMTF